MKMRGDAKSRARGLLCEAEKGPPGGEAIGPKPVNCRETLLRLWITTGVKSERQRTTTNVERVKAAL